MQPVHPKKECPTMQLANIELGKLSVSKANMRYGSKAPDVSDLLPSIRARGVLVPLLVRPGPVPRDVEGGSTETFRIVAGSRRVPAAQIAPHASGQTQTWPCRSLEPGGRPGQGPGG